MPISNTKLCLRRNEVYQLTCSRCNQQYIGSTTRFIRDRWSLSENIPTTKIPLLKKKKTSIPARMKTKKALRSRLLWTKTTPLIYASMKHFTLESISPHSTPEKNVLNLQTLYCNILFQRRFLSAFRGPLFICTPPLELCILLTLIFVVIGP